MHAITQKLQLAAGISALLIMLGLGVVGTQLVGAQPSTPCPGSKAPYPVLCSGLPLGCPGSTQQGPVDPTTTLKCKYGPANGSSYACPAAKCTFTDGTPTLTQGQGIDKSGHVTSDPSSNPPTGSGSGECKKGNGYCCGSDPSVPVSIDFGCKGKGNPILDMTFAIIRFLSIGVGLVIVGSMVWAGIQYTASRGEPQGTEEAIKRIRSNVTALVLFIFAYAILNYVVPGAVLK